MLHLQFVEVEAGGAVLQTEAGGGDKGDIRADMIELVTAADAGKDVVVRLELTAAQDHFAVRFVLQRQEGVQRMAHGGEGQFVGDGVDDRRGGGATVKNTVSFSLISGAASRPMRRFSVTCLAF